MKLYELTGVKQLHALAISDLIEYYIEHSGYNFKGEGASATVFKHPTKDEIIKFWLVDDAYDAFIKYALENQGNEHIVKVTQRPKTLTMFHKRPTKDERGDEFPNKLRYVRLEMLKPITKDTMVYGVAIRQLLKYFHETYAELEPSEFEHFDLDELPKIGAHVTKRATGHTTQVDEPKLRKFFETFVDMYKSFGKAYNYDLHDGNVMMRGSVPVIIDPFSDVFSMTTSMDFNFYSQRDNLNKAAAFTIGPRRESHAAA